VACAERFDGSVRRTSWDADAEFKTGDCIGNEIIEAVALPALR
jgi:hypothetical protein